jgi:uncharacterized protein with GYD domain
VSAVNEQLKTFGCSVIGQYAVLGMYDFVTVVEAPDNKTVAHLSVDLGSRGTVNIVTLPAVDMAEFVTELSRKEQLGRS